MNTSTSIDSRLSTALRTATRIALRTATRAGRRPDSITIADGKSSNNSPDSAPRAHKPRTLTAPLFAAGRCFGLSPGTLRTPGANPPASPPRTLTHRALTLLAPLFLAGALLGVSSNAAAQLAVNLGADQTVEPGASVTINAEVTGAVAADAALTTVWSFPTASAYFTALGQTEVTRLGGIINTNTGLTLTVPAVTAAVLAAATPPLDTVEFTIRLTVTDPMAAAGQGSVVDNVTITVMAGDAPEPTPPSSLTLTVTPATVMESATATTVTATVTLTGGVFPVARVISFGETTGDTATPVTDYTAMSSFNITIPANATSASETFAFTAVDDMVAEPGGETVNFRASLLTVSQQGVSSMYPSLTASITILDPVAVGESLAVSLGDDQTVAGGDTVTLTATVAGSNSPDSGLTVAWSLVDATALFSDAALVAATRQTEAIRLSGVVATSTDLTLTFTATASALLASALDVTYRITVTDPNAAAGQGAVTDDITITIEPAAAPTPPTSQTLTISPTSVTESATPTDITATVTLNGGTFAIARQFSLSSLSGGSTGTTATAGTDYTALGGVTPLTIPANMTSGTTTFPFSATVDTIAEPGGETLTIRSNLLAPSGFGRDNSLARVATTLTINDPVAPTPPTSLALSASPATVTESSTNTDVTITATFVGGTYAEARRGFFQASGGTATVGADYTSVSRTNFTIPANAASVDVVVPFRANVDTIVESGGETVIFTGSLLVADTNSGANDPLPVTSATITIIDAAAQPVIVVNAGADQTVAPGDTITLAGAVTTSSGPAADVALAWSLVGTTGDLSNALRTGGAGTTAASTAASAIRNDILAITNARNGSIAAPPVSLGLTSPVMFTVRLTGTATGQQDGTDDVVITVEPPVTGEFAVSLSGPSTVAPGATVTVTATVTGAIAADEDLEVTWTINNLFDFFSTWSPAELGRISGQLSASTGVTLTFTAPAADEVGEAAIDLDIRASVNDPDGGNVNPVPVTGDFTITVDPAGGSTDAMPTFSVSFFADQAFTTGTPVNLTLPAATGGDGALTYSLTPAIPGLTLDPTTRVLSGTPTVSAGETSFTYTVTDEDDDTASLVFDVEVMLGGPAPVRPVFFQVASSTFTDYDEGGTAVGGPTTFFAEAGTETVVLTLGGADAAFFSITQAGALSFSTPPDYEMPRGMAPSTSNTNTYRVTITATASRGLTQDQGVTVHVVDVDEMVDAMPTFSVSFFADQAFMTFTAVDLTLPAATGGDGALTYSLTPAIAGLTLNPTTRVLSGTPTSIVESTHTYTVTDEDGDIATLAFDVVVTAGTPPVAFAVNAGADQTVAPGATVTLTATVTGANTPDSGLTVAWSVPSENQQALAAAVTTDAGRLIGAVGAGNTLTTTFTATAANLVTADVVFPIRVTVTDPNGAGGNVTVTDEVTITFMPAAGPPDTTPAFSVSFISPDPVFTTGIAVNYTLPAATGGNAPLTYTLTPAIAGLTLNPTTRVLSGTPTVSAGSTPYTYTVTDEDGDTASLFPDITVMLGVPDTTPAFSVSFISPDPVFTTGTPVNYTLPAATGGNGALTYTLTPAIAGLTLDPTTHVLSGTPTVSAGSTPYTYTVTDEDGDFVSLFPDITVNLGVVDTAPTFSVTSLPVQNYLTGTPVNYTLPVASGGNAPYTFTLTRSDGQAVDLPGLTFNAGTNPPTLTGTPTAVRGLRGHFYTVHDSDANTADGDRARLSFNIAVRAPAPPPPSSLTVSIDPTMVTESATPTTITATVTFVGGTYTRSRIVQVGLQDGTALEGPDFSPLAFTTLTIPANTASGTLMFPFTAKVDGVAESGGETAKVFAALRDTSNAGYDGSLALVNTNLIINDPAIVDTSPAFAAGASIDDQSYLTRRAILSLTLPAVATPGNGATTYTLTPAIAGLTLGPTSRVLSGTPTTASTEREYTYTATDADDDTDTLTFNITVVLNRTPDFGSATFAPTFTVNVPIPSTTLPAVASSGNGLTVYFINPNSLPAGLTFDPATRILSGTPTAVGQSGNIVYQARDSDADTGPNDVGTLFFRITIEAGIQATGFTLRVIDTVDSAVIPRLLEGQPGRAYEVVATPTPAGSVFAAAQQITFAVAPAPLTPPASASDPYVPYTPVAPGTVSFAVGAASATFTFTMTPGDDELDHADYAVPITATASPSGATGTITGTIRGLTLRDNDIGIVTTVALASVAVGATTTYEVSLSEAPPSNAIIAVESQGTGTATVSPAELTFSNSSWNNAQTVTVTGVAAGTTTIRHSEDDVAGNSFITNDVMVTVTEDTAPTFGGTTVMDQTYTVDAAIESLTLPTATGGNGELTYSLTGTLAAGLVFNPSTRVLSGTPTATRAMTTYTYVAQDGDANMAVGDRDTLTFTITVEAATIPVTGFTVSVTGNPGGVITEAREGTTRPIAVTATPTPAGSVFAADQMVTFTVTPASPAARPDSPDDPFVAYNNIAPGTVAFAVGAAEARRTFSLRPTEDAFDHADFPLTVTVTAQPSGISGTATITLIDNDIRIITSLAATTVVAGTATATTYDVQLSEQPPATATVTVASQGAGTATVSPATLTFTTANWNTARTVTVTGVAAGSTTIRHTAPDASGFSYVTNDVDVTVTAAPVAPIFTNVDDFDSPITTPENRAAVGADGFFAATGTGTVTYALTGADMARFTLSTAGTLTFNDAPDFEMPRGMAPATGNTNDYALTITATNSVGMTPATVTVSVTDVNEAPVVATITPSAFTEYTQGTFDITVTDVDAGQTLTYALSAPNHGATLTGNTFTWTPGEDDGGVARTFSFTVTDSGTPPMMVTGTFDITATELANRAPTGATITAAAMLTYPDTITLEAAATDPDTGDTLTYSWNAGTEGGSIIDVVGGTATYEPPTLAAGDAARTITITVTVSDSATPPLTTTATHTVTVNPPVPMTAPVFTNLAMFTSPISVAENTAAAGAPNFFAAPGTGATSLTLDGEDSAVFAITDGGTLTFNTAPDFEMPRNGAPAVDNTNDYALTVTATNAFGMVMSGAITVRVTDVNEAPVLAEITSPTNFVEYSQGTFNIPFSDPDAGTVLTVSLTPPAHGATLATDGTFTWTPGEDDGGVARTFTVAIADDGSPMMSVTRDFTITAMELDNRAPTDATITGGTAVTSPATITLEATAMDADTGTTLTYTWTSDATGDSFDPATGTSTSTVWTPPVLTAGDAAVTAVITVTVSDGALTDTDTHTVTVNPPAAVDTAPAFTNMAMFGTAIMAAENQTGAGVANFFAAPGTAPVTLMLGGTDAARFDITDEGTLTFNDAPNFEMPRGIALSGTNTNDYALTVTAMNSVDSVMSGAITVRVTDANDRPVLPSFVPPTFTEYSTGTLTLAATDEDIPAQMLTYTLTGETRGATITGNVFTWTPGESDGGVVRQFGVTVTDDGTPPRMVVSAFNITAMELLNRAPTGATITADASVTNPNDLPLAAEATDPDTGDMLTYTWSSSATGGSFSPATGASVTWTPPTVTAATMVTLTVTINDTTNGSVTAMHVVTVNPAATAPVFTGDFTSPIMAAENQTAVGAAGFFAATGATAYALTGTDMGHFTISTAGTLTFDDAPNFEMPRGAAPSGTNTNTYTIGITAQGNGLTAQSGNITIEVTDANDRPTVASITPGSYTEHSEGTFEFVGTDEDAGQTLTYALTGTDTFGATMSSAGTFRWTPREEDGGVLRSFNVSVTDDGSPSLAFTTFFTITAAELPNRAPTGTVSVSSPAIAGDTVSVFTSASDPDSDTLTYAWSSSATGDTFGDATIASTTWVPASVSATTTVTLTVTISDGTATITPTADVVVNPAATAPVFDNPDTLAFMVAEGTTAVGTAGQFSATGTGAVTLTLGGTDAGLFTLAANGGLAFSAAPNFEMPRGVAFDATTNTNDYPLTVTAAASGLSTELSITVSVTDANDAPVLAAITPPAFEEYSAGTFDITATDEDAGQSLTYSFVGPNHGATLTGNTFAWTPGEADGGETRTFNVRVTDDGSPLMLVTGTFDITATELANRAPTGATITAAAALTAPNTITLEASATDPDTDTTLTYAWAVTTADGGTVAPTTGASTTYTPPALTASDSARMIVITVTVSDDATTPLTATATHTVTVNPPVAANTPPTFTNLAMFTTAITVPENTTAVGAPNFFAAVGSAPVNLSLGGVDAANFAISSGGTLVFQSAPDFEAPSGGSQFDSNTHTLTVSAMNSVSTVESGTITVTVTDVNEAPVLAAITPPAFTEYMAGSFDITATDVDRPGQTLAFALTGETHGDGAITTGGTFTWTPREMDGATERMFTVEVTDTGTPAETASATFAITAAELPNRAPTSAMITNTEEVISNPDTLELAATASDPDTDDTLTYTWSAAANGGGPSGTFSPATGATGVTWTPPDVTGTVTVTLTVTVSDGTLDTTDTHNIFVGPVPDTAPAFAAGASIPPQIYIVDMLITPATLPAVQTPGNGATIYQLLGTLPDGLAFDADTRVLSGTPTATSTTAPFTYTARDSDDNGALTDVAQLIVQITVNAGANAAPTGATITVAGGATMVTNPNTLVVSATATDDDMDTLTYRWSQNLPTAGGSFSNNGIGASVTWTPPTVPAESAVDSATFTLTVTVTDGRGGSDTATTLITVNRAPATGTDTTPTFGTATVAAQVFTMGTAVDLTLPEATGGNAPYTYTLVQGLLAPPLPDGLTFNAVARTITGTPTTAAVAADYTYTAADADMNTAADDTASLTISITVSEAAVVDSAPTFGSARIPAQVYTVDVPVNLTLPLPTSNIGEAPFTYDLLDSAGAVIPDLSTVIPGLTFTAAARTITGTPTGALVSTNFAYRVSDSDANMASSDTASLSFSITVNTVEADTAPTFFVDTFPELIFVVNQPITQVTLPSASGGNGDIVYGFSSPPVGLNFEPSTRVLSGTPTEVRVLTRYGYSVRDTDGNAAGTDADTLLLSITVTARADNLVPAFADGASIAAQNYIAGSPITPLTLPVASGGDGTLVYSLRTTGANPTVITDLSSVIPGLTLDITARTITGTPTMASGAGMSYTWNAEDMDNDLASLVIDISVAVNAVPTFDADSQRIANQAYSVGQTVAVTLPPTATSGNGDTVYTLTPALPDGLTFNANRTITGRPTTETASAEYTYTARDSDSNTLPADEASLTFQIVVGEGGSAVPTFGGATVSDPTYVVNQMITPLTLPAATSGDGAITYDLTPTLPAGLLWTAADRTITGTASTAATAQTYTYTAMDEDSDTAMLMFSITIDATNSIPAFDGGATIEAQTFTIGTAVDLTLPAATGGNGASTYTLTPALPAGLTLDAATGVLTGTPTTVAGATTYTYTAGDTDGSAAGTDEVSLMFSIMVMQAPPSAIRLSVNPAAVTESSAATDITVTATLIGGLFTAEQSITLSASSDSSATVNTDYTPAITDTITIPGNGASATATFSFTAAVDAVTEAGGETVIITGTSVNGVTVSPATLTINDYTLAVNAGDDQTVASGGTITLTGEVTGSTDTTAAWALSDSAAARAALVAAGLMPAEATTEVTRLTTALGTITTLGGTLTAPAVSLGLTDSVALAFTLTATDNTPPAGQTAATAMDEVTITVEAAGTDVITTTALNEAILPEVTRALVNSTSSSITRRVGQAVGSIPVPTVGSFNLAGQSMDGQDNLAMALRTQGEAMSADSRDIKEILAGSDFVLPLNATGGSGSGAVAFWGSGEYRDFSGESDDLDWDGDLTGFQLGLDARLRDNLLVGVAVSMLETDVDYEDDTGILGKGDYELDMTSAHPYIGWRSGELDFWATVGYGTGDLEIKPDTGSSTPITDDFDVNLLTVGGGGSGMLWQDGATTLRLKGEVSQTTLEVEGETFAEQEIDATSIRIAVEATRSRRLAGGGIFEPSVEVAARHDGGDGETGGGAEVGGALRYRNPATGLTADGRIRALMGQGGNYEEWGISGTVRVAPGTDGQGLSFSLSPGYGDSGSGIQELWRHGLTADDAATTDDYAMKLDARVGYGFGFTLNEHHGILTPYSELTYGTTDSYRMGLNWAAGTRFDLTLLGERREPSTDPAEHAVLLKGEVRF